MRIRPERTDESPSITALLDQAFGDPLASGLFLALRTSEATIPELSLVADDPTGLVGHVMLSRIHLDSGVAVIDILMLTPLAVMPDRQREGIGSSLVRAALAAAGRTSFPLVVLEGSPTYYARFGFVRASARGVERPSALIPDAAFQVVSLAGSTALPRGRVVYPQLMYDLGAVGP